MVRMFPITPRSSLSTTRFPEKLADLDSGPRQAPLSINTHHLIMSSHIQTPDSGTTRRRSNILDTLISGLKCGDVEGCLPLPTIEICQFFWNPREYLKDAAIGWWLDRTA